MASKNVSFETIPASIRKPGKYFEFNTRLAVRTLPGNLQKVLVLGQRLAAGTQLALQPVDVSSDEQAAQLFGRGSMLHLMARAAIKANPYIQMTMLAVDDAGAGVVATSTVTYTGTATAAGVATVCVAGVRVDAAIAVGTTAAQAATAMVAAITAMPDLPVTAGALAGVVTLTSRHKGAASNDIKTSASSTAAGLTVAATPMAAGATDPDLTAALAVVAGVQYDIIACPYATSAALTAVRTHIDFVSGALEQRPAVAIAGWPGTLATGMTLSAAINSGRIDIGWHKGSALMPCQIAAAFAAVVASEEDPARPLNTLALTGLDVTPIDQRPLRTEQENALYNGLTPFEIGPGDKVQIVRAVTTYTLNPQGVADISLLDLTTIRTLDYVRKACRERIALRFPRDKLSDRTPAKVRSELLDVLYKLEELEIIEAVDDNKDALIVERDLQDPNRLNAKIPADVVNGLHVFAGRIDLLL